MSEPIDTHWLYRRAVNQRPQSKAERQWRSRQAVLCACGNAASYGETTCRACTEKEELNREFNSKLFELEACQTVEELKQFIRENML